MRLASNCLQVLANFIAEDAELRDELIDEGLLIWLEEIYERLPNEVELT